MIALLIPTRRLWDHFVHHVRTVVAGDVVGAAAILVRHAVGDDRAATWRQRGYDGAHGDRGAHRHRRTDPHSPITPVTVDVDIHIPVDVDIPAVDVDIPAVDVAPVEVAAAAPRRRWPAALLTPPATKAPAATVGDLTSTTATATPPPPRASTSTLTNASIGPKTRATVIARFQYVERKECMVKSSRGYWAALTGRTAGAASRNLIF